MFEPISFHSIVKHTANDLFALTISQSESENHNLFLIEHTLLLLKHIVKLQQKDAFIKSLF